VHTAERISSYADEEAGPRSPLLSAQTSLSRTMSATASSEQREKDFLEALDAELAKIIRFYLKKEAEVTAKYQELSMQVQRAEGLQPEQAAGRSAHAAVLVIHGGMAVMCTQLKAARTCAAWLHACARPNSNCMAAVTAAVLRTGTMRPRCHVGATVS
jgi:acetyl esterase/lipase